MGKEDLASTVYFSIPQKESVDYRNFIEQEVIAPWLIEVNGNDPFNSRTGDWNQEGGLNAMINEQWIWSKFYKFDRKSAYGEPGIVIRDHPGYGIGEKIAHIADDFEEFLKQNSIPYERKNFNRH